MDLNHLDLTKLGDNRYNLALTATAPRARMTVAVVTNLAGRVTLITGPTKEPVLSLEQLSGQLGQGTVREAGR